MKCMIRGNVSSGKCHSGNCQSGKCPFGEMSARGTVLRRTIHRGTVHRVNIFGELPVWEKSVGELPIREKKSTIGRNLPFASFAAFFNSFTNFIYS